MKAGHVISLYFKENLFSNFLVIIIKDEKHFRGKKYMSLGSPTLVQRAWRTKYV